MRSTGQTTSSRRSSSSSCPTSRSPSPRSARSRLHERPPVILTSNRTRSLHEALRRRCLYHWIPYPSPEREQDIIQVRAAGVTAATAKAVAKAVAGLRGRGLAKPPGIAEAIEWADAATLLEGGSGQWPLAFRQAIGAAIKDEDDLVELGGSLDRILEEACA